MPCTVQAPTSTYTFTLIFPFSHALIKEQLCSESAFFWRLLVEHLRKKVEPEKAENLLERCLPLGSALSDVLRSLLEDFKTVPLGDMEQRVENEFVLVQLFRLSSYLDQAEEFGRQAMRTLVRDCLTAPSNYAGPGLVTVLLDLLITLESDTSEIALSEKVKISSAWLIATLKCFYPLFEAKTVIFYQYLLI